MEKSDRSGHPMERSGCKALLCQLSLKFGDEVPINVFPTLTALLLSLPLHSMLQASSLRLQWDVKDVLMVVWECGLRAYAQIGGRVRQVLICTESQSPQCGSQSSKPSRSASDMLCPNLGTLRILHQAIQPLQHASAEADGSARFASWLSRHPCMTLGSQSPKCLRSSHGGRRATAR